MIKEKNLELDLTFIGLGEELSEKKEDLKHRLEKFVISRKLIMDSHFRSYLNEKNGQYTSMIIMHELTNAIVVVDAEVGQRFVPSAHYADMRLSLIATLEKDGWIFVESCNDLYNKLKARLL